MTSRFDKIDITNPDVKISSRLPNDYILKRLVPIHLKKPFNDKRCIVTRSAKASPATIIDTYLVLIPITIRNSEKLKQAFEYFGADDLTYRNDLLRQIGLEENDEKAAIIRKINRSSNLLMINASFRRAGVNLSHPGSECLFTLSFSIRNTKNLRYFFTETRT